MMQIGIITSQSTGRRKTAGYLGGNRPIRRRRTDDFFFGSVRRGFDDDQQIFVSFPREILWWKSRH